MVDGWWVDTLVRGWYTWKKYVGSFSLPMGGGSDIFSFIIHSTLIYLFFSVILVGSGLLWLVKFEEEPIISHCIIFCCCICSPIVPDSCHVMHIPYLTYVSTSICIKRALGQKKAVRHG